MTFAKPALPATCSSPPSTVSTHWELHLLSTLLPVTCSSHQCPCPDTHTSGEKWASWEWGSWRWSCEEAHGAACTGGCEKQVKTWPSCTAHLCHAKMHVAFKASGCCLLSRPWHQCSVQASFHNSIEEAEGWVRKENRKNSMQSFIYTEKNHEKTGGEDPAFLTQCLNSG